MSSYKTVKLPSYTGYKVVAGVPVDNCAKAREWERNNPGYTGDTGRLSYFCCCICLWQYEVDMGYEWVLRGEGSVCRDCRVKCGECGRQMLRNGQHLMRSVERGLKTKDGYMSAMERFPPN